MHFRYKNVYACVSCHGESLVGTDDAILKKRQRSKCKMKIAVAGTGYFDDIADVLDKVYTRDLYFRD